MELKEIQDILKLVNKTNLTEVEIEREGFKLKIRRKAPESNVIYTTQAATPVPPQSVIAPVSQVSSENISQSQAIPEEQKTEPDSSNVFTFRSPMIGTFYRASSPDSPPFIKVGDSVQKGQVMCIIEAMKLFNEIESEVEGKVVKILLEDAQPVEYDQPLFLIEITA